MSQIIEEALPEYDTLTDIKSEQVRIIFASTTSTLLAILLSSFILAAVQWDTINHTTVIAWFVTINLLSLVRLLLYIQFKKLPGDGPIDDSWHGKAVATSIASGITWGAGAFLLFSEQSLVHQVLPAFVIAGICAGAITTLSSITTAARGFVVCALAPIIFKFNLIDSHISFEMTIMTLLFMAILLLSAKRLNQIITESLEVRLQRELAEQTIIRQAQFDELTELPNRRLFLATLRQEMAKGDRYHRYGAVFFIDLDRFKLVNDSLGHAVGDELLIKVAQKISKRLRQADTMARLGGDEFVVLLPEVGDDQGAAGSHASMIADEIRKLFSSAFVIQGHEIHLTISIGIALFPAEVSAEDLLKYADVAMYRAKNEGRDGVRLFSAEMQETVNQQRIIEKGLRQAINNNEFELYFQGQYDSDNRRVGAETLLRWNHPDKGVIAPGLFIDIAEQSGLIVPIGDWVLRSACEHLISLDNQLKLSVNVSPRQFSNLDFVDQLQQVLADTGANPERLKFEITESLAMANIEHTIDTMNQLKQIGISFSVDDFGTGYSSLNYLHRLPVDELKIDQSFVRNISSASDHAVIVDTIIVMAQKLNLEIVAEGIESVDELDYLKARQCDRYQGYYFARPVPFDQFTA
ncbi:MAG: bifunctional diguanylate cyclase/phosphodiesterase [Gammaproteobacteria bacterium]|nr:bifunctional diguanylate cyclase/phosphodiesterase [Gammaproteobacteria bacterium]